MRVITFICFAVTAILASPPTTRYDPITAAMNFLTRQVPFPRIAGGNQSPVDALPYLVSFQVVSSSNEWFHLCGGSILSPTKIVTAAHCAKWMTNHREWRVVVGKNDLWSPGNSGQYRYIKSVVIHPGFCKTCLETDNDVAIIEVSTTFEFNEFVNKIDLIESEPMDGDGECVTSGWEVQNAANSDPLRSYTVPVVPRDTCASKYPDGPHITGLDICAGDNGMGPCYGTGRPLVCDGALAGVASWTSFKFCYEPDHPTVFANVAVLQGWIKDQL